VLDAGVVVVVEPVVVDDPALVVEPVVVDDPAVEPDKELNEAKSF
jgi:hypothetical protein